MENRLGFKLQSTADSFLEVYQDNLSKYSNTREAYEATEEAHEKRTGFRHYNDYTSFLVVKARNRKKRRND